MASIVDLDELGLATDLAGIDELTWLLEVADWDLSADQALGRTARAWQAVHVLAGRLGEALAGSAAAQAALHRSTAPIRVLNVVSRDSARLALPWELASVRGEALAERFLVNRVPGDALTHAARPIGASVSVLSVAPRPRGDKDVRRAATQQPLLEAAARFPDRLSTTVVRPPTFARLTGAVRSRGQVDVLHFDGHGVPRPDGRVSLLFEPDADGSLVSAELLISLLRESPPALVLLNACRSGWSAGVPSLSYSLAAQLPGTQVVAMSHSVTLATAGAMLEEFFPTLARGGGTAAALARAHRHLRRITSARDGGPPTYLIPVLYGPPLEDLPVAVLGEGSVEGEPRLVHVYDWERELHRVDAFLEEDDGPVTVQGPLHSGKSTLISMLGEYRRLVDGRAPDTERLRETRDCWARGANRTITLSQAPIEVGARWWNELVARGRLGPDERTLGLGTLSFEALNLAGAHVGTMGILSDMLESGSLRDHLEELKWGSNGALSDETSGVIEDVLDDLDGAARELALRAGFLGGFFSPWQLALVTQPSADAAVVESAYSAMTAFAKCGLALPYWHAEDLYFSVSPVAAHALRRALGQRQGGEAVAVAERSAIELASAVGRFREPADESKPRSELLAFRAREESELTATEQFLDRALGAAVRLGDDGLSARVALSFTHQLDRSTKVYRRALGCLSHRMRYDAHLAGALPLTRQVEALAHLEVSEVDEQWDDVLTHAATVRAYQAESGTRLIGEARLLVKEARATWRNGRSSEAESMLAAADVAARGDEDLQTSVAFARHDFEVFASGRRRTPPSSGGGWIDDMRLAEEQGDLEHAASVAERAASAAVAARNPVEQANAQIEHGRLLFLVGDQKAISVLENTLRLQEQLGRPIERILYLLGGALALAGRFGEAIAALDASLAASDGDGRANNRADIVFERGSIALRQLIADSQESEVDPGSPLLTSAIADFSTAAGLYGELSNAALSAGAATMLAQCFMLMRDPERASQQMAAATQQAEASGRADLIESVQRVAEALAGRRPDHGPNP